MRRSTGSKNKLYTNGDIVVIATYRLGGMLRHIHLEDVAMKAAELAPRKFSWKKYPEQINLEAVRLTLKNEIKASEARIIGSIRNGWMLTPEGFSWCLATPSSRDNQDVLRSLHQEIDRAKTTAAFSKTVDGRGEEVSILEVEALLRVNNYFTERVRRERVMALANAAVLDTQLRLALINLRERGFDELEVKK